MSYAVQFIQRSEISALQTAAPFDGLWVHSTDVKEEIFKHGWAPNLVMNTIYGAAIYLARETWNSEHKATIECVLDLAPGASQDTFPNRWESGRDEKHFFYYLKEQKVVPGYSAGPGTSSLNQKIAKHFLKRGVKAVNFIERGIEVVAVYDPSCLRVVDAVAQ